MIKINDLAPNPGEKKTAKRVGRGISGKGGKTAGRGSKGQHARNTVFAGFEGGQVPTYRRSPKAKGFNNPFRVEYLSLNLDTINDNFQAGETADPGVIRTRGVLKKQGFVKILGRGTIDKAVTIHAHGFSNSAKTAIEAAGGSCVIVPLPWGDARRPAQGNQHTNR